MGGKGSRGFPRTPLLTHQAGRSLISFPGRQLQLGVAPGQAARAAPGPTLTTRLEQSHPPHLGLVSSAQMSAGSLGEPDEHTAPQPRVGAGKVCKQLLVARVLAPMLGGGGSPWQEP